MQDQIIYNLTTTFFASATWPWRWNPMVVEWKSDGGERQSREKRAMEERERERERERETRNNK